MSGKYDLLFFNKSNWLFFSLLLFCITLPFDIKFNNVAIILVIISWIAERNFTLKLSNLLQDKTLLWLAAYYFLSLLTLTYSNNIVYGFSVLETQLLLLLMPIVIGSSTTLRSSKLHIIKIAYSGWCILVSWGLLGYALLEYILNGVNLFAYYNLTNTIGLHPIYFANYLALAGFIIFYTDLGIGKEKQRWVKAFLIIYIFVFISMLSAVSVLLSVIALGTFIVIFKLHSIVGIWKSIAAGILLLGIAVSVIYTTPYTRSKVMKSTNFQYKMTDPDSVWNSVTIRLAKWTGGIHTIQKEPFLGVGIGDEKDELMRSYEEIEFLEGIRCEYNVHNQYLSSWIAGGLFLLGVLLLVLFVPLVNAWKDKDYLFLAFMILILISFITENFLKVNKGIAFFSFFYSIFGARRLHKQ